MAYKNIEKQKEYRKKWASENKDKCRSYLKKYRDNNREKILKRRKKNRLENIDEYRRKDREIYSKRWNICQRCKKDTFGSKKRKYCDKCRKVIRVEKMRNNELWKLVKNRHSGEEIWNYKGGVTPIRKQFWDSSKYKKWRKEIFERDDYTCQNCKARSVFLEAHHKKERYKIWEENKIKTLKDALNCEELWDKNNAVTLCRKCHNLTKNGNPKHIQKK